MAAQIEGLLETDPERGLVVRRAKKQGVDSTVGFARDDVLDCEPGASAMVRFRVLIAR